MSLKPNLKQMLQVTADLVTKKILDLATAIEQELGKKVTKSIQTNKIYGTNQNGEQALYDISDFTGGGDASNKVDKTDEPDKIYGTDENGSQTLYTVEEEDEYETPEDPVIRLSQLTDLLEQAKEEALRIENPIGKIWQSENPTNPYDILGFGTWHRITDKYLWAINDNESVGDLGGSETSLVNIDYQHQHNNSGNINVGTPKSSGNSITLSAQSTTLTGNIQAAEGSGTTLAGSLRTASGICSGTADAVYKPSMISQKWAGTSNGIGQGGVTINATHTHTIPNHDHVGGDHNHGSSGSQTNSIQTIDTKQPKYGVYVWRRVL